MRKLNLKKSYALLSPLLCLLLVTASINAQEAYKIDETTYLRCDFSEIPHITDSPSPIFVALNGNKEARAAIILYGMEGKALRYAKDIKRWLSEMRGVEPNRLVPLYGGQSEQLRLELWLIPKGAVLPKVERAEDDKKPVLYDEYGYLSREYCGSNRPPALAGFAEALNRRPSWQGYIIVHHHRNRPREESPDPDGYITRRGALNRAAQDKRYLVRKFSLPPARIETKIVNDDKWTRAELWLVPPGAELPDSKIQSSMKKR